MSEATLRATFSAYDKSAVNGSDVWGKVCIRLYPHTAVDVPILLYCGQHSQHMTRVRPTGLTCKARCAYVYTLILLYMSSYYYVSAYYCMCPHTTMHVSAYYYMCHQTTICVLILLIHGRVGQGIPAHQALRRTHLQHMLTYADVC